MKKAAARNGHPPVSNRKYLFAHMASLPASGMSIPSSPAR